MKQYHKQSTRRRINTTMDKVLYEKMVGALAKRGVEPRDGHLASIIDEAITAWLKDEERTRSFGTEVW